MYREDPNKINYSMIEQTKETRGAFGTERIAAIKEHFKNFLENIIP